MLNFTYAINLVSKPLTKAIANSRPSPVACTCSPLMLPATWLRLHRKHSQRAPTRYCSSLVLLRCCDTGSLTDVCACDHELYPDHPVQLLYLPPVHAGKYLVLHVKRIDINPSVVWLQVQNLRQNTAASFDLAALVHSLLLLLSSRYATWSKSWRSGDRLKRSRKTGLPRCVCERARESAREGRARWCAQVVISIAL